MKTRTKRQDRRQSFILCEVHDGPKMATAVPLASMRAVSFTEAARAFGGRIWVNKDVQKAAQPVGNLAGARHKPFVSDATLAYNGSFVYQIPAIGDPEKMRNGYGFRHRLIVAQLPTATAKNRAAALDKTVSPLDDFPDVNAGMYGAADMYAIFALNDGNGRTKKHVVFVKESSRDASIANHCAHLHVRGLTAKVVAFGSSAYGWADGKRAITLGRYEGTGPHDDDIEATAEAMRRDLPSDHVIITKS